MNTYKITVHDILDGTEYCFVVSALSIAHAKIVAREEVDMFEMIDRIEPAF